MNVKQLGNSVEVSGISDFDVGETLESGQMFRYERIADGHYSISAMDKNITVRQTETNIELFPCTVPDFENHWAHYFDLHTDYAEIKRVLSQSDAVMKEAISYADGIRLMNQDPWECLVSFIISQNNHIPRIKRIIENLCERYGEETAKGHAFPTPESLAAANIDDLLRCNTGFRAKYILQAAAKISGGEVNLGDIADTPTAELKERLLTIHGVGNKVSDCVLLFSCGRRDMFPVDVWIGRIMRELYFGGEKVPNTRVRDFANGKFGAFAGYAQQYLFHYARTSDFKQRLKQPL